MRDVTASNPLQPFEEESKPEETPRIVLEHFDLFPYVGHLHSSALYSELPMPQCIMGVLYI